ncbi:methyltransferase family protein [Mesorhizobium erdmanii]|uniref:methyltransferase family protein n=1 Tax=Mesorhizobium erdmanii TaxID=1777866 RepID=UPI000421575F|nr:isoprenylcysteine carboxylmethyltransferase family protein [Mesorhizobium erdmanii]
MLTEDFFGRAAIVFIMTILAVLSAITLFSYFYQSAPGNSLAIVNQVLATVLSALQVFLTVRRLPPKGTAQGIEPRVTSVVGTFLVVVAMFLTPALQNETVQMVALGLIFIGMVSSVFCLYWLGRSFSIMATARQLVTSGPYSIVRHPLYICEATFVLGMILSHFSVVMVAIGVVQFILQYRRARNEEAILRETFAEYNEYARRVPMLFPRFLRAEVPAPGQ